jgi:hypothetical protein
MIFLGEEGDRWSGVRFEEGEDECAEGEGEGKLSQRG